MFLRTGKIVHVTHDNETVKFQIVQACTVAPLEVMFPVEKCVVYSSVAL